ncbi:MAG: GNAT family N-acetyltransferase [Nitrososphaerota archaeon]|nr:GNAT family N-acetyltransferase [Nitrososphaerota archaeon]
MSVRDYGFAVDLANTMDWGMDVTDFAFNQSLEPDGCLTLLDGAVPVGIATCVSFGKVGWFGNFIVNLECRRQGAGRLLLDHAVKYLQGRGVETIGLYAYPCLEDYYGKFGFKTDNLSSLTVMHNSNVQTCICSSIDFGVQPDFSVLTRFDSEFFGADRSRLLRSILLQEKFSLYCASFVGKEMVGYILSKTWGPIAEVGPLVCHPDRLDMALELLKVMLQRLVNRPVTLYLPQNQGLLEAFLLTVGFRKSFSLSRMFLGESKIQSGVCLAESLERG